VALDGLPLLAVPGIFLAIFVGAGIITFLIKALDKDSIVSLRRVFGLAFISNLVWTILLLVGSLLSWVSHISQPSINEFVLGAFFAWSLELLVVNGAFISSTAKSLCIAAIQPALILAFVSLFVVKVNLPVIYTMILGLVVLGITTGFLLKFKTFKTEGVGINSLQTFQSFLKSWVLHKPANLENYFTLYSQNEPVTTRIILANAVERAALVLPGVHPGPFFPVGSYDLSELIFDELRKYDIIPMVLHGVGGHERNLPTNELTRGYAASIASTATSSSSSTGVGLEVQRKMRGPNRLKFGDTMFTTLGFGNKVVVFLSSAPYNTDDLEPKIVDQAVSSATEMEVELMLVDAHNSIGGEDIEQLNITEEDWKKVFSDIRASQEEEFEIGIAHSSELQRFEHGTDISDGGIAVLVFKKRASTYALITCDSNNAVVGLRQRIIDELRKENVDLIELCTSDTHKSAARYMTNRGYRALGEDSSQESLVATIKKLEKIAESRLSRGEVTIVTSQLMLPLIGAKSLNDFATLTKEALQFAKAYASAALVSAFVIFSLALVF
jgi:putative membrane protein